MANIIVPPTWIVKIPPNDQLHSSLSKQIKSLADVENREVTFNKFKYLPGIFFAQNNDCEKPIYFSRSFNRYLF